VVIGSALASHAFAYQAGYWLSKPS
jgi:hypothetical protein